MFPPRYRFFRQHWTVYTYSMLIGNVPMYFLLRPLHEHQFAFVRNWKEALLPSDLPDKYTDDLMRIVDDELFIISSKQKYPMTKSKFQLLLVDKFQSQTFSSFDIKGSAFFTFSSRLALNDIKTIREYYSNLHDLFFKEIVGNPESGLQKLLKLFSSKAKINIETAQINDNDLQKVLLSENAKKFAISRELLFANSWRAGFPGIISTCIVAAGWLICRFGHQKLGGHYPAFFIAFILSILFHYFLLKWYFIYEMFSLDEAAAKIDNDHLNGGIEYFKSNIELGKFLHQILISSSTNFTKEGNFLADPISFTERLENLNKLKKKPK